MRPAVYGRELIIRDDKFVGINFGYNFYCEHETSDGEGMESIVRHINGIDFMSVPFNPVAIKKARNLVEKQNKSIENHWRHDKEVIPHIISPACGYLRRELIIDNSKLRDKGVTPLLEDGNYTMMMFDLKSSCEHMNTERLGQKRKFAEDMLLYTPDYVRSRAVKPLRFAGAWSMGKGFIVLVSKDYSLYRNIPDIIENSHKGHSLGVFNGVQGITTDRGLTLMMLDVCAEKGFM